ncbi:MAG: TFIIB-type zinc ribbon-containing protein [Halobacteriales archaeon]|nr:TFIIB-type zinc ribbon-containing protein [Halobacteriales archaeon]
MKLRGRRECADCGERWSYFETGAVECPACGSVRSRAIDEEGALHTAGGAALDLDAARRAAGEEPVREVARLAADAARAFLAERGFLDAGELRPLDDVTVAAAELRAAADHLKRSMAADEAAEWYLLALLRGAPDGERPDELPVGFEAVRGRAIAAAVERYRADLSRHLTEHPDADAQRVLGTLRDHVRRVEALDGDVPPSEAEGLLEAARAIGEHLRGEDSALARAERRLSDL